MSVTLEHTPLPWLNAFPADPEKHVADIVSDADLNVAIAHVVGFDRVGKAKATLIIRACNNHKALVDALRWALGRLSDARACGYGGVEAAEIEAREYVLVKMGEL